MEDLKLKTIFNIMKENVIQDLANQKFDLLGISNGEKTNTDGNIEKYTRLDLEIPKNSGKYSRLRFSCKIPQIKEKHFSADDIDYGISITLKGLEITFIDTKGNVYFKANGFEEI